MSMGALRPKYIQGSWCFLAMLAFLVIAHAPARAFDFDDLDRIDRAEQGELLERAKLAARAEQFGEAQRLIGQARNKAYDPKAVAAAETVYGNAKSAYEDRKRREEQERLARIEAERTSSSSQVETHSILESKKCSGSSSCTDTWIKCGHGGVARVATYYNNGWNNYFVENDDYKNFDQAARAACAKAR